MGGDFQILENFKYVVDLHSSKFFKRYVKGHLFCIVYDSSANFSDKITEMRL